MTPEELAALLKEETRRAYQNILASHIRLMRLVWRHPTLTPEQIFAALGTDAAEIVEASRAVLPLILKHSLAHAILPPPNVTVTPNPDGTVTVITSQ